MKIQRYCSIVQDDRRDTQITYNEFYELIRNNFYLEWVVRFSIVQLDVGI